MCEKASKQLTKGNFRLEGHIDVPAIRLPEIELELPRHIELTRAEPGCLFFNVDACPEKPGRFKVSEAFVDRKAFEAHQQRIRCSSWADVSRNIPREYESWVVG